MPTYEELLVEAEDSGLVVKEKPLRTYDGRIKGSRIAIRKDMTQAEKACTLAEEIGHSETTSGNILDMKSEMNIKQELCARRWAYNKQIGLAGLCDAFDAGCRTRYDVADYLGVTEEFLSDALKEMRAKYGVFVRHEDFVLYFTPYLNIIKII